MDHDYAWYGAGLTHRGLVRASNQDSFVILDAHHIWAVADGMGGHAGGEIASRLAMESISNAGAGFAAEASSHPQDCTLKESLLQKGLESAQSAILTHAADQPDLTGMGTTIVVLWISPGPPASATIAHVGDSRAYLFRNGALRLLTRDHSLMEDYLERGLMTPEAIPSHPLRHMLTRALGLAHAGQPNIATHSLDLNDRILLCTDGLTKMVDDDRIATLLAQDGPTPKHACEALVEEAIRQGGDDNVTVVVVRGGTTFAKEPHTHRAKTH